MRRSSEKRAVVPAQLAAAAGIPMTAWARPLLQAGAHRTEGRPGGGGEKTPQKAAGKRLKG